MTNEQQTNRTYYVVSISDIHAYLDKIQQEVDKSIN